VVRMSLANRRAELVQAALRVTARLGVNGATTRAIVAEAGMPLASFHYAFASRHEMMRELLCLVARNESVSVSSSARVGDDIRSTVRDALTSILTTVEAHPEYEQVLFELQQYALRTPDLWPLAMTYHADYRLAVRELLVSGAKAAEVGWSLPVDDVARMVVSLIDGIVITWLADRDSAAALRTIEIASSALAILALPDGISTSTATDATNSISTDATNSVSADS